MFTVPFSIDHFWFSVLYFVLNIQLPPLSNECGMLAISGLLFLNCIRILFVSEDTLFYTS